MYSDMSKLSIRYPMLPLTVTKPLTYVVLLLSWRVDLETVAITVLGSHDEPKDRYFDSVYRYLMFRYIYRKAHGSYIV